jgi:hypothetical protein
MKVMNPSHAVPAPPGTAWMRIAFPAPGIFVNDPRLTVLVNGWCAYDGSFKNGFDVRFPVTPGPHLIVTRINILGMGREKHYTVMATHGHATEVWLDYSRFWGNFTGSPRLASVALG